MSRFFKYCPMCGAGLDRVDEGAATRMKCGECGYVQYLNPSPAAGVLVRDEKERILLVRRRFEPYRGLWTMPAGFIEYGEDAEGTAVRELKEETGLVIEIDRLHAVESCRDDPRGNTVLVLFEGRVTGGELAAGDDAEEVGFFPPGDLPEIAFACQRRVLGRLAENHA
jgi:8-oxo-dGTP diphosphatase